MGLRPGHCYSDPSRDRAYTRTAGKVQRRNYIGAAPGLRTRQFNMGNPGKEYTWVVDLIAEEPRQLRDNSIEAARMMVNRYLVAKVGKDSFFTRIRIYPHHILRENKQAQGAGADRVSKGMQRSFGKAIGRAARVKRGSVLISVLVMENHVEAAKEALLRARARLSCKVSVNAHQDVASIGSRSKKERIIEEKVVEEEEKVEEKEVEEKAEEKEEGEEKKDAGKEEKTEKGKAEDKKKKK